MGYIINAMTISQQMASAAAVMANTKNSDGTLMFPGGLKNAVLVQSTLRGEAQLNTTSASYSIPILQNSSNQGNVSTQSAAGKLLSLQDGFLITDIAVLVSKRASATDTAAASFSYAPASIFATSGSAAALTGMYQNGWLKLQVNQQVITPYWDLFRHYNASRTQPATNADYTSSSINYISSEDFTTNGFYPVVPGWYVDGAGNVEFTLNLPSALAAVETYGFVNVIMRGFLLQNASSFKRN